VRIEPLDIAGEVHVEPVRGAAIARQVEGEAGELAEVLRLEPHGGGGRQIRAGGRRSASSAWSFCGVHSSSPVARNHAMPASEGSGRVDTSRAFPRGTSPSGSVESRIQKYGATRRVSLRCRSGEAQAPVLILNLTQCTALLDSRCAW